MKPRLHLLEIGVSGISSALPIMPDVEAPQARRLVFVNGEFRAGLWDDGHGPAPHRQLDSGEDDPRDEYPRGFPMTSKPSKVIATAGATPDSVLISHTAFPDIQADGDSLEDAAANFVQDLTREIGEVDDESRRDSLLRAVADIQDYIERPEAE